MKTQLSVILIVTIIASLLFATDPKSYATWETNYPKNQTITTTEATGSGSCSVLYKATVKDKDGFDLTPEDATLSFDNCIFSHSSRSFQASLGYANVTETSSYSGTSNQGPNTGSVAMRVTVTGYKVAIAARKTYTEEYIVTEGSQ